eukprot:jgi/Astpho2/998/fgenesh1_pg.00016_%23_158_t
MANGEQQDTEEALDMGQAEADTQYLLQQVDRKSHEAPEAGAGDRQLTLRAVVIGLVVGSILCFSNTYFGLQTGWVTMGSLQSAILGFGVFRVLRGWQAMQGYTIGENVITQTTAVATATMPLAAGFVGVIPALSIMTPAQNPPDGPLRLSWGQLILWALALAFLGVFMAVPLRVQTILKEKLRFPSGTATANVIRTLHGLAPLKDDQDGAGGTANYCETVTGDHEAALPATGDSKAAEATGVAQRRPRASPRAAPVSAAPLEATLRENLPLDSPSSRRGTRAPSLHTHSLRLAKADSGLTMGSYQTKLRQQYQQTLKDQTGLETQLSGNWESAWAALLWSFVAAGAYSLLANFLPWIKAFPVFTWVGLQSATAWGWVLAPSMGYVGQGMIMGPRTAFSMLGGAIAGYGILGPFARRKGWAPGSIGDWKSGATGWILWVSLAIMLGDSLTSLALLLGQSALQELRKRRSPSNPAPDDEVSYSSEEAAIPRWSWIGGIVAAAAFCTAVLAPMLHMPFWEPLVAIVLALLVAVLAVRALGETDLNPVSGVSKLTQGVFALVSPGRVVPNLVAGAIAEAGAQQAGDMMQDFKTAHLLGVCPRAQFSAMLLGSGASVFVSVAAYALYTSSAQVPGPEFPAPTAEIWLDMAELVNGGQLPPHVLPFCCAAGALAALLPISSFLLQRHRDHLTHQDLASPIQKPARLTIILQNVLPSGIGFGVGMYVSPQWTLPRVIGSVVEQTWLFAHARSHANLMVVIASGLVLGEGTASIVTACMKAFSP